MVGVLDLIGITEVSLIIGWLLGNRQFLAGSGLGSLGGHENGMKHR